MRNTFQFEATEKVELRTAGACPRQRVCRPVLKVCPEAAGFELRLAKNRIDERHSHLPCKSQLLPQCEQGDRVSKHELRESCRFLNKNRWQFHHEEQQQQQQQRQLAAVAVSLLIGLRRGLMQWRVP
ncbi:hypothetical protein FHG87_007474 [Trinorchestia longiramus]|nr:hypothetical protein FHG87_007474 [Trinorchestia longiramus]